MISRLSVSIVRACLRAGTGGSPTAVLDEVPLSDEERCRVPVLAGTSHAVFVSVHASEVSLRFFTAGGELPACGHGTVAALAFLAARAGGPEYRGVLRAAGRSFAGRAVREGARFRAVFEPGPVELREPTPDEWAHVLPPLGVTSDTLAPGARVASIGRARLLVPVVSRSGRLAARMFAPSIGVPEDIANANSTACLAADLAGRGVTEIAVDMGDALGSPATITASARPVLRLGGVAEVAGAVRELSV
ncbi:PhzF family phenazine biosynthesis protein [Streptomyces sp. NPDC088196]|uniref:PhzF family phenazine biosynthesis protein n=1 Tax=Streptomyces sp. NPDC088196 TaxID=3154868 RepID=UPI0034507E66